MTDLNTVNLGGRLTREVAVEKTKDGTTMLKISMAVNRSKRMKKSEEWEDKAIFVDLAPVFGNYADMLVKHLRKGTYITVEGYLDMDSWISEDGKKHQVLKVVPKQGGINPWIVPKPKESSSSEAPAEPEMNIPMEDDGAIF